jgi:hypothetical protein
VDCSSGVSAERRNSAAYKASNCSSVGPPAHHHRTLDVGVAASVGESPRHADLTLRARAGRVRCPHRSVAQRLDALRGPAIARNGTRAPRGCHPLRHGVDLDAMSEAQLEALYAGLVRVAALSPNELQVLVQSLSQPAKAPPKLERLLAFRVTPTTSPVTLPRNCHTSATPAVLRVIMRPGAATSSLQSGRSARHEGMVMRSKSWPSARSAGAPPRTMSFVTGSSPLTRNARKASAA